VVKPKSLVSILNGLIYLRVAILFALLAVPPAPSHACTCMETPVRERAKAATAVFSVEVLSVRELASGEQEASLRVLRSWKGKFHPEQIVTSRTVTVCCMCGLKVKLKERLLVYAYREESIVLSTCSDVRLEWASEHVKILDQMFREKTHLEQ
jgi:hypothetical protein